MRLMIFATSLDSDPCCLGLLEIETNATRPYIKMVWDTIKEWGKQRKEAEGEVSDLKNLIEYLKALGIEAKELDYGSIYL